MSARITFRNITHYLQKVNITLDDRGVKLTILLQLEPRSRKRGSISQTLPYALMAQCLISQAQEQPYLTLDGR
jgi:hypothetical protein